MNCARRSPPSALQLENVRGDMPAGACRQSFAQLEAGVQPRAAPGRPVAQAVAPGGCRWRRPRPRRPARAAARKHERADRAGRPAQHRPGPGGRDAEAAPAPTLRCAPGDLRSVLDNLIENALRYTPEGGVVDVRLVNDGGRSRRSKWSTPARAFRPICWRACSTASSACRAASVRGSGLGLSIAQAAAQRCGLRITAAQSRGPQRPGRAHRARLRRAR